MGDNTALFSHGVLIQVCEIHPSLGDCELVDDLVTWIIENHKRRRVDEQNLENPKLSRFHFQKRSNLTHIFQMGSTFAGVCKPASSSFTCFLICETCSLLDMFCIWGRPREHRRICAAAMLHLYLVFWVGEQCLLHIRKIHLSLSLSLTLGALVQDVPPFGYQQDNCTEMAFISNVNQFFCHMTGNQLLL